MHLPTSGCPALTLPIVRNLSAPNTPSSAPVTTTPPGLTPFSFPLQDLGDFNIATSSLHALSNTLSRTEKHSPHSSPRQNRKALNGGSSSGGGGGHSSPAPSSTSTSAAAAAHPPSTDAYSSGSSSSSSSGSAIYSTAANATSSSLNNAPKPNHCSRQASTSVVSSPPPLPLHSSSVSVSASASSSSSHRMSAPVSSSAVAKALNRMPSTESGGTSFESSSSPVSQSMLMLHLSDPADLAPPLPPRKCTATKPEGATPQRSSLRGSKGAPTMDTPLTQSRSAEEVLGGSSPVCTEFEVPRTVAPPVPKHQTQQATVPETKRTSVSDAVVAGDLDGGGGGEEVIVGPAETISGLIDTRPLEARKPIIIRNPMPSPTSDREESHKEGVLIDRCVANGGNNLYQLKTTANVSSTSPQSLSHIRHQSLSTPLTGVMVPPKSVTTPQFQSQQDRSGEALPVGGQGEIAASAGAKHPLLYENVSIHGKDCNVPYENINLEYIARLVSEGYSKESAITALGISRNNIEMACDILHEFVSKSGT